MKQTIFFLLPDILSVRISQMNDDPKFSKENHSLLVAVATFAPLLILNVHFDLHSERANVWHKNLHLFNDCSPFQQVAMAEEGGTCSLEGWATELCVWG